MTELSGSSVTTHIAEDETAAEHLAQKLHENLPTTLGRLHSA
ncbi:MULTISPECIES: hypothetical protein [Streptomyces]|nr:MULTISPECIES: hypothetical protein [Streptomyces]